MQLRPLRPLTFFLVCVCAACAGALTGATLATESQPRYSASPQALAYFERMMHAHDSTGVEQAACVTAWTLTVHNGVQSYVRLERVERAFNVRDARMNGVSFACGYRAATVHTHSFVCAPSDIDREGEEVFGVVVCPRPTRFAVFSVTPRRVP